MSRKSFHPLTSPQLSIWYTERMYTGTSISNVAGTLRIKENVDFILLEKAIQLFIKNNDGIRLRFCLDENGNPQQYVSEYVERKIQFIDFSIHEDAEKAFYDWNSEKTLKPFELLDSDLYSITMVKINDTDGGFYIITHHLISDAWNMSLIGNFIVDYYCKLKKEITDDDAYLPKPSYLSFIENDIAYKTSNRYEKDKLFWEETFREIPEITALKARTTNRISAKAKRKTFVAPTRFINRLKEYCSEHKVSPYPLFLSALAMYINRVSGKEDIILGTPILNRLNHSDKNTSGMFISTIPLRIGIHAEEPFQTLTERIMEVCSSAFRHQRYPFEQIIRFVRDRHNIKENLYDIVLSYQNTKFDKSYEVDYFTRWHFNGYQPNSLTVHINDRDDEGTVILDYDYHEDLYDEREIEYLHQYVSGLLWHALDNPGKSIYMLEMLPESEKRKVLCEFNDTAMEYPREKLIHQLFEEQVERTPDNVAIVFEGKTMTYRELNERANQLAHVLHRKGVKRDDIVGILVPRSFELIIGILAILKAGGAFMTIESDFPSDRIRYMIENSKAAVLLTSDGAQVDIQADRINIFDETVYSNESKENLEHINSSRDLVYVIYTSGTTGSPKGVMIEHRSLHNFTCCFAKEFSYDQASVVLSVASVCFDLFIMEFMPAILNGSKLVLANNDQRNLPFMMSQLIKENTVSDILFTPSRMKLLIEDESNATSLENIKHIMLGGEKLETQLVRNLKRYTNAYILNAYGPTEATIAATFKGVYDVDRITIGKPISNTKVFILDQFKNPVPLNIQGELYISGECLARGYVSNPDLTSESFTESPFDNKEKLYKTGDLARWYPNGEIEYLGRKDKQIKLRGYRIELGEIEDALLKLSMIKDVAIDVRSNTYGDFICAFFVSDQKVDPNEVKSLLSKKLPKYMIPTFFAQVESIPINSSGKKDIKALAHIQFSGTVDKEIRNFAENDIERKVEISLCKLLNVDRLDVDADIFEYGADSLTVIQLISVLAKDGYKISTEQIYNSPTIRKIAQQLTKTGEEEEHALSNCVLKSDIVKLISKGKLEKLDSAAICYLPDESIKKGFQFERPLLYQYIKTSMGNIGLFVLPMEWTDLYRENERLVTLCIETIHRAEELGARVVSLTGLIPSATKYGKDIYESLESHVKVTTGHATTASSVILSLDRLLSESARDIRKEKITILGMGSVGTAVTELLLQIYPYINEITLCDLDKNQHRLIEYRDRLQNLYKGNINILLNRDKIPNQVYESSLIIGATNVPDIIDVNLLKPGTMIIDDSGPHCFSKKQAVERLNKQNDILFTEGGVIKSQNKINKYTYIPKKFSEIEKYRRHFFCNEEITGCILSSLLTAKLAILSPTLGIVHYHESVKHYYALKNHGFIGADLHCDDFTIPDDKILLFREAFHNA